MASRALGTYLSLMMQEIKRRQGYETEKTKLLGDPAKADKMVASFSKALSPVRRAPKKGKFILPTEGLDAVVPSDHPMKGFGLELRERFASAISDPQYRGTSSSQILRGLAQRMYTGPGEGGESSRHVESLRYKHMADTSLFQWGDDERLTKPALYDAYRERVREEQLKGWEKEDWMASPGDIATTAAAFGGITAAHAAIAGPLTAGAGLVTGAATGALVETLAHPIKKAMHWTEWAQSRMHSDKWLDRAKVMAADIGVELPFLLRGDVIARRLFTVPKMAKMQALASPTSGNLLNMSRVQRAAMKGASSDEVMKILAEDVAMKHKLGLGPASFREALEILKSTIARPGGAADPREALFRAFQAEGAYTPAARAAARDATRVMGPTPEIEAMKVAAERAPSKTTHKDVYKAFTGLDDIGLEEALSHPAGINIGTLSAADRQGAREIITGVKSQETAEKVAALRAARTAKPQKKAAFNALDSLDEQVVKGEEWIEEQVRKFPGKEAEIRAKGEEMKASTLALRAQTEKALGYEVTGPPLTEAERGFRAENIKQLTKKRNALQKELEEVVTLTAPHKEGTLHTVPDAAKRGAMLAEMDEVSQHIRTIELELNPVSNEMIRGGTEVSLAELEHGLARTPLSEIQEESMIAAQAALAAGKSPRKTKELANLLGRGPSYVKGGTKAAPLETKHLKYTIDTAKTPAAVAKEMEGLTEKEAYTSLDELQERLWNKKFPDKPYREVETAETKEFTVDWEVEGRGKQRTEKTITEPLTGEEVVSRYADTSELEAKMTAKETAVMDAAVDVWHEKAVEAGVVSPGERVPGIRSMEHYQAVRTGKDLHTPHTGWRPVPAGQKEADAAAALEGKWLPVTVDESRILMKEIGELHTAGAIDAEEALHRVVQLDESIGASPNISEIDKMLLREGLVTGKDFTGPVASLPTSTGVIISQLKKQVSLMAFLAALGISPLMFELFAPKEAEAGVLTQAARAIPLALEAGKRGAAEALMKQMAEANLIVPKIVDPKKMRLLHGEFMRGLPSEGITSRILKGLDTWAKDVKVGLRHAVMSPYQKAEEALNIGKYLMNNPAVVRASYQAAEYTNRTNMEVVLGNIFREAGVEAAPREVATRFRELIPRMKNQVMFEFHSGEVDRLTGELANVAKGKGKKVLKETLAIDKAILETELNTSTEALAGLEGSVNQFHQEWAKVAEKAAVDMPSVRVYLSVWDGPEFKKAPFMKNITLSNNEQVLAGRLREQLLEYKTRLDAAKIKTIKGPYMPVTMHPEFRAVFKDMMKGTNERTSAYMRMYRRSPNSRPLMPASETSMLYYVGDTERRLQNIAFWKSNWKEVQKRTSHLPLMQSVFKDLEEGIKPVDMTVGNKMANSYVQFEAMKRLWLNPSAGGKHLMKMTGTMVTVGFKESLKQIPKASRHLLRRGMSLAQQGSRAKMAAAGIKGARRQDKVIDSYLHSMIPARNARHRLIDMGIHAEDEAMSLWRNTWHRSQNVGASWINMAEVVDRGVSVLAGTEMAAKRGLTAEQAAYGSWDLLLKNNFLSRELNPAWMRDPKMRALFMFQGTPYKIFERRLVTAIRSGRAIKRMGKAVFEASKTPEGRTELLSSIRTLRGSMKGAEQELKVNLIADALKSEVDFFGTPVVNQFAKDILTIGAVTMGGASAGMNLKHHIFHIPFLSGMTYDPTVAFSPGILAAWRGHNAWQKREAEDDEWLMTKVTKKWLGPTWIAPDMLWKAKRISEADIPEMYRDSKFKYLFAIPYKEKKL